MISVASMSMTTHPVSVLPATSSHGNPQDVCQARSQALDLARARARAMRSRVRLSPARSRARRTVGPLGAVPSSGARWVSSTMSLMLVAPSAIATAIDTSTMPRSSSGDDPFTRIAPLSWAVSPAWSAALRSRTAPACPMSPLPSAVIFRARSHSLLCCMAKSAPFRGSTRCGNP